VTLASDQNIVCTITNTRQTGTLTVNKVLSPANDPGRFNLQIDGATAGTGANVGNGGTTGAIPLVTGAHTVREVAGTGTSLSDYTASISCSDGTTLVGSGGPLTVTVTDAGNVVCTITNVRKPAYGHDPGDTDPGDPYGHDPGDTTPVNPYVPPTTPVVDPGSSVAGKTIPVQPVTEEVLAGETEQPAPAATPGGLLPRTGAGIAGEAMLALLLMMAGLALQLVRRRRSPQA
jgi:hypothetical protein